MMTHSHTIKRAAKWSVSTEILAKLMAPITNMLLARILAPEAFGVVATIVMITSFADIFTEAGFQKYLIHKAFKDEQELDKRTNIAFWSNLILSIGLWCLIFLGRNQLASALGSEGLGDALAIASLALPLTSFSSIQIARYRRAFDFKSLFFAKLIGILIPLGVTVPLALMMRSFWALIIGTLATHLSNAIILTRRSEWKPSLYFDFSLFKEMLGFSIWPLTEQLLGWAHLNIGIFIVGNFFTDYYLGMYKTSMASVNQVMAIVINAFSPILLATLSRCNERREDFDAFFYAFEEKIALVVLPMGIGLFIYQDLFTTILLGNQWREASAFIGLWALVRALFILFGMFSMEVFVALGRPQYSTLSQAIGLAVFIPALLFGASRGYHFTYVIRSLVVLWYIVVNLVLLSRVAKISIASIVKASLPYAVAASTMGVLGCAFLAIHTNMIWQMLSIALCGVFYVSMVWLYPQSRKTLRDLIATIKK